MAYPVTLAQLQTRVLQRVNLEGVLSGGAGDGFLTPQELTDYINVAIAKWYDEIRGTTWNGNYYRSPYVFQTTPAGSGYAGQVNPPPGAVYKLPPDFLSVISVDAFVSPSLIISCVPFQEEERNFYRFWLGAVGWFLGTTVYYQIQGAGAGGTPQIVFMPPPQSVFQMQVNYIPTAPKLTSPSSSIDSVNGWDEFIVADAAIQVLMKAGRLDELQIMTGRREEERQRIRSMAPRRDNNSAERVHEIDTSTDGWFY